MHAMHACMQQSQVAMHGCLSGAVPPSDKSERLQPLKTYGSGRGGGHEQRDCGDQPPVSPGMGRYGGALACAAPTACDSSIVASTHEAPPTRPLLDIRAGNVISPNPPPPPRRATPKPHHPPNSPPTHPPTRRWLAPEVLAGGRPTFASVSGAGAHGKGACGAMQPRHAAHAVSAWIKTWCVLPGPGRIRICRRALGAGHLAAAVLQFRKLLAGKAAGPLPLHVPAAAASSSKRWARRLTTWRACRAQLRGRRLPPPHTHRAPPSPPKRLAGADCEVCAGGWAPLLPRPAPRGRGAGPGAGPLPQPGQQACGAAALWPRWALNAIWRTAVLLRQMDQLRERQRPPLVCVGVESCLALGCRVHGAVQRMEQRYKTAGRPKQSCPPTPL